MKKLHICFLGNSQSIHLIRWVRYFLIKGHIISLISFEKPSTEFQSISFLLPKRGGGSLKYFLSIHALKKILRKIKPDILQCIYAGGYGLMGAYAHLHPFVLTAIGSDILLENVIHNPLKLKLQKYLLNKTLHRADLIHCQAEHLAKRVASYGILPEHVIAMPYGIDIQQYPYRKQSVIKRKIVSTRFFEDLYNVDILIRAMKYVVETYSDAHCTLLGGGPLKNKFLALIRKLHLQNHITILDKISVPQKYQSILQEHSLYVSTSKSDGASQSLFEAMALGLFPIVTNIPANREWIRHEENGLLCEVNAPLDLAKKIAHAFENQSLIDHTLPHNRTLVETKASLQTNLDVIEKKYYTLLS